MASSKINGLTEYHIYYILRGLLFAKHHLDIGVKAMVNYQAVILGMLSGVAAYFVALLFSATDMIAIGVSLASCAIVSSSFTKYQSK